MNPVDRIKIISMTNLLEAAHKETAGSIESRRGGRHGIAIAADYEAQRFQFWERMAKIAKNEIFRLTCSEFYRPNLCYRCGFCHPPGHPHCDHCHVGNPGPARYLVQKRRNDG